MKRLIPIAALLALVAFSPATTGLAQLAAPRAVTHERYTPEQRQQSDATIQAALSQLQSASSALQAGNPSGTVGSLNAAVQDLNQALPIYHGYREMAMHKAANAIKALQMNRRNSANRAALLINSAISDAQAASQHLANPNEHTPAQVNGRVVP